MTYVVLLTVPQLLLYVLGLPLTSGLLILRNRRRLQGDAQFKRRYGLLFKGYRPERAWWEVAVAMRKVAIVAVGTFGSLMGFISLQAMVALVIVFFSIVAHLVAKPFDVYKKKTRMLHALECVGIGRSARVALGLVVPELVAVELAVERGAADAEELRCALDVPARGVKGVAQDLLLVVLEAVDRARLEQDGPVSHGRLGLLDGGVGLDRSRGDRLEGVRRALAEEVVCGFVAGLGVEEDQVRLTAVTRGAGIAGVGGKADQPAETVGLFGDAAAIAVGEAEAEDGARLIG